MKNTNNDNENFIFKKKPNKINSSQSLNSLPLENINNAKPSKSSSKTGNHEESIKSVLSGESVNNLKQKIKSNNQSNSLKAKQTKNLIFEILSKDSHSRSNQEVLKVGEYLSKNYKYFIDLKNNNDTDSQLKIDKLSKICKLEKFKPNEIIILYGDIGDKFYIVLEGLVEVFIPVYYEKEMTPYEFLVNLERIKLDDRLKYNRLKSKNSGYNFDNIDITKVDSNTSFMKSKFNFWMENEDKKGEFGEGFSFGEIALIKKTTRNATVKSVENTVCLSISKNEYNEAMKEIEIKKLGKDIELFKQQYKFFECINNEKMIRIFNCLSKIVLYKGDFLFHQNDINEYIYLVVKGNFEVYSYISYSWLNEYYDYIDDSLGNILFYMISNSSLKYNELQEIIKKIKLNNMSESPMKDLNYNLFDDFNMNNKNNLKDNLYFIKNDEEQINNKKNIFRIDLNKVDYNDIFGLEDCFDFKRKFYSVKCVSSSAELKCIKISDLINIIWSSKSNDYLYFLKLIMNKKNILKNKIINAVKNLEKKILFGLDIRYENLINYNENIYNKKENIPINELCLKEKINNNYFSKKSITHRKMNEINRVVSAIKIKGYKMSIQDILDKKINILPSEKSEEEKKIFRKNKSINSHILKNLLKTRQSNPHLLKIKKKSFRSFNSSESKNDSFISSPITSKKITTNYTTIKNSNIKNNFNNIDFTGLSKDNIIHDEEINNDNLGKNMYKLNRTNNLKESMSLLDKIIKTPNYLIFSTNNNKKLFHYKNNIKRKSKNIFNYNKINQNPMLKFYSIDKSRFPIKNKTHIFSARNNMKLFKKSIPDNNSQNIKDYVSPRSKIENKRKDIFSTIRKAKLINKIVENKSQYVENSFKKEKARKSVFYIRDKIDKLDKIENVSKDNTFTNRRTNLTTRKIISQKDFKSSVFNK